jgi:DNA replication protein DnaC
VARRIKEAHFPKVKTLDEFNFQEAQHLPVTLIGHLAEGGYIGKTEPVLFLGDTGTGKTHLATALGVAACRVARRRRSGAGGPGMMPKPRSRALASSGPLGRRTFH